MNLITPLTEPVCKCAQKPEKIPEPLPPPPPPPQPTKTCKCAPNEPPSDALVRENVEQVDQLWPKNSERFKVSHQVTADKSRDLLKSETSVKCLKVKENFPFDVDTQVDLINKRPDGVHVTTTITKSGLLEVITEGPDGVIETTLVYTNSGNVEVVTEIHEYCADTKLSNVGKLKALPQPKSDNKPESVQALMPPKETGNQKRPSGSQDPCGCNDIREKIAAIDREKRELTAMIADPGPKVAGQMDMGE